MRNLRLINNLLLVTIISIVSLSNVANAEDLSSIITSQAYKHNIDRQVAYDLAMAESSLNPNAEGTDGERGLYQIKQSTWEWLTDISFDKAYEIEANIKVAMKYLAWIKRNLGERYTDARLLCAYNGGLSALKKRNYEVPATHRNKIYRKYYEHKISTI